MKVGDSCPTRFLRRPERPEAQLRVADQILQEFTTGHVMFQVAFSAVVEWSVFLPVTQEARVQFPGAECCRSALSNFALLEQRSCEMKLGDN